MKAEQNGKSNESGLLLLRRASPTCSTLTTRTACSGAKSSNMGSTFRSESNLCSLQLFMRHNSKHLFVLIRNNKCGCKGSPTGGRSDWQDERWGKVQPTLVAQKVLDFWRVPACATFNLLVYPAAQVRELGQVVTCVTDILEVGEKTTVAWDLLEISFVLW